MVFPLLYSLLFIVFVSSHVVSCGKKKKPPKTETPKVVKTEKPKTAKEIAKEQEEREIKQREMNLHQVDAEEKKAERMRKMEEDCKNLEICHGMACNFIVRIDQFIDERRKWLEQDEYFSLELQHWLKAEIEEGFGWLEEIVKAAKEHECLEDKLEQFNDCLNKHWEKLQELDEKQATFEALLEDDSYKELREIKDRKYTNICCRRTLVKNTKEWRERVKLHPEIESKGEEEWFEKDEVKEKEEGKT